jgi:hypothetical protein
MSGTPRVLSISFRIHMNPMASNTRFSRLESAVRQVEAAVTTLIPRLLPMAERVEVDSSWTYEWWKPKTVAIPMPVSADNPPREQEENSAEDENLDAIPTS